MTTELIIAIAGLLLGAVGAGFGLTAARKNRVETIVAILDELGDQYTKLKAKYDELEDQYTKLKAQYGELDTKYKLLLEENVELRAAMERAGYDFPDG